MVIDRTPFQGHMRVESIRLWTIVLIKGKDMVQADGHHIIYTSLP